jgi:ribosome-associated translation inhibitor RaiA
MKFPDHGARFPIELDTKHVSPSVAELERMGTNLHSLLKAVDHFPVAAMHVVLERFPRTATFRVKVSLTLTGTTLVSVEDADHLHAAFEGCVNNLLEDVHAYKSRMAKESEWQKHEKGTHQDLLPDIDPDPLALEAAVQARDYSAFRLATFGYEEPLRKRVGRWIERYPALDARIGKDLKIADLVEEVFLDSFEQFPRRPQEIRFGDWLESLIDPAVKEIARDHNGELDNARLAQSAREAEEESQGP